MSNMMAMWSCDRRNPSKPSTIVDPDITPPSDGFPLGMLHTETFEHPTPYEQHVRVLGHISIQMLSTSGSWLESSLQEKQGFSKLVQTLR